MKEKRRGHLLTKHSVGDADDDGDGDVVLLTEHRVGVFVFVLPSTV